VLIMKTRLLIVALIGLLVVGCSAKTDSWELKSALSQCKEHEGVDYISHIGKSVMCNDGTYFDVFARSN